MNYIYFYQNFTLYTLHFTLNTQHETRIKRKNRCSEGQQKGNK